MTLPIVGRTAHKALIDDFGAVLTDLKAVSDDILRQLKRYASGEDPNGFAKAALDCSDLQSVVARLVKVHADMVILVSNARSDRVEVEITRLSEELDALRTLVEGVRND